MDFPYAKSLAPTLLKKMILNAIVKLDHMQKIEFFYIPKTEKGRRTSFDCRLDRFIAEYFLNLASQDEVFVQSAFKFLASDNPKDLIQYVRGLNT